MQKSRELGRLKAALALAQDRSQRAQVFLNTGATGTASLAPQPAALSSTLQTITSKVDAELLRSLFPPGSESNIATAAPFLQAALQEFKVTDPRLIAAIIATIRVETPRFETYEEPIPQARALADRPVNGSLGNLNAEDAVKYRGRGYIGLTGRANYRRVSEQLGLGTRLLDFPDDAKSPEVATRVLVGWFVQRQPMVAAALDNHDLATIRRIVAGNTRAIDTFAQAYEAALARLTAMASAPPALPASAPKKER